MPRVARNEEELHEKFNGKVRHIYRYVKHIASGHIHIVTSTNSNWLHDPKYVEYFPKSGELPMHEVSDDVVSNVKVRPTLFRLHEPPSVDRPFEEHVEYATRKRGLVASWFSENNPTRQELSHANWDWYNNEKAAHDEIVAKFRGAVSFIDESPAHVRDTKQAESMQVSGL